MRAEDAPLLGYVIDDRYALVDFVGGGGMGAVYKGRQLSVDRLVAIKVLHASLTATREDRQRFEDEARAISKLQSPNTVTLFDFGLVREGPLRNLAFMVLEFVEGETLTQRLRADGPMSAEGVAGVLEGLADALDEAHAHGIVHRDLKPANILLSYDHRGAPQVKVIDFGVARMGDARELTQTGFSVGTPSYMAPEQFDERSSLHIDGRADVYALGVVTFLLLTGSKPFRSASVLELGQLHRKAAPPALPGADSDPRQAQLDRVVQRALAKDPTHRFSTVGAMARAFAKAVEGSEPTFSSVAVAIPVVQPGAAEEFPTPTESFIGVLDAPRHARRGRGWLLATIGIGLLIGAGVAFSLLPEPTDAPIQPAARPVIAKVDGRSAPATAPASAEATHQPQSAASVAPPSAARGSAPSAQPDPAAPARPRTTAPVRKAPIKQARRTTRRKTTRQARPDPQIPAKRRALLKALAKCQCRPARLLLEAIEGMTGGASTARALAGKVKGCLAPDVDEICVNGKVEPR